ncbi:MAG: 50S ribosomal protein L11 methyltransferase [Chloroflexota bacterium]|nr:50S ribosomal protein L11 methyltransferase [Chloroflexota bacterium]MDE2946658.1 50S ribosomal protein L11 methyltransferase [Chloroflexota bacterium]
MSSWIEVSLCADGESAEAIAEVLERFGHQGVSLEQTGIAPDKWDESEVPPGRRFRLRAYFPADERAESTKKELETALGHMRLMYPMPQPSYKTLDAEDWAEAWKAHYQPLRVGQRLLIRPLWIDVAPAPGEIEIALDPGMAFGTGTHPTTQLCLEALERLIDPAQDLLDLGSGSGILSIAAAKLGARNVLALDIDPIAVEATAGNARANGVEDKIIAGQGSLETVLHSARRFDVIVVNILARVILQLTTEGLGEILRPGGLAIFSGIIDEQLDEVETALSRSGLQPYARHQRGDWLLVEAKRAAD